ncbi:MAG: hypothetical protein ACRCXD_12730 [Luteolibacter sp.]
MKIAATEYYRKGELLPFVSWKIDSVTTFDDHQVEFDLTSRQVVRTSSIDSEVIAQINDGYKGSKLPAFFGTVESDSFTVTKRKMDWLSGLTGNVIFEITLKNCGTSITNMVMRYDFSNSFRVKDILELELTRNDRAHNFRFKVEGTCAADHQDLGEVIACLLLHHNEEQGTSS